MVQRDNAGGEKLYLRALSISEKAAGPEAIETARLMRGIGRFYERTEKFGRAVEYYKRSLAISEKVLGAKSEEVGDLLFKCACSLSEAGKPEEAKQYRERAEAVFGSPQPTKGGVLQGYAIMRVEPAYPPVAKQQRVHGAVVVEVTVDECGNVMAARAIVGPAELRDAAVSAARGWKFAPTRLLWKPVKVIGTITFNFNL
jgi:TonB family protein